MKQHTLNIYDTNVKVYEFEAHEKPMIQGVPQEAERINVLQGKEMFELGKREPISSYSTGYVYHEEFNPQGPLAKVIVLLAEGLDTKQLANIFLSLGASSAVVIPCELKDVYVNVVKSMKEEKVEIKQKRTPKKKK